MIADPVVNPAPAYAEFASLRHSAGGHLLTRLVSQRLGAVIAWLASRAGFSPSAVTLLGTLVFLLSGILYVSLPQGAAYALLCLALLQLAYALDCADGQLARATARTSAFGAWLDVACDYVRNIVLGMAVAIWLARNQVTLEWAVTAGAVFSAGAAVQLHTVTVLRRDQREARLLTTGAASRARLLLTSALDSATVLLLLALLRLWPPVLMAYVVSVGAAYLLMAGLLARIRLSRA